MTISWVGLEWFKVFKIKNGLRCVVKYKVGAGLALMQLGFWAFCVINTSFNLKLEKIEI